MHRRSFVRAAAVGAGLALLLGAFAAPPLAMAAGPIGVTTTADTLAVDGACSLREAIRAANLDQAVDTCRAGRGADRIRLPAGTYSFAIAGTGEDAALTGDLDITADITISGAGRDQTIVDAAGLDRVFDIFAPARVTMTDLTITGGAFEDYGQSGQNQSGAGILNAGTLSLTQVTITRNETVGGGGGISSTGPITASDTLITDNFSREGSGGLESSGDVRLDRLEISGNVGGGGAQPRREGPVDAGGLHVSGYLVMTRSLVSGNGAAAEWTVGGVAMGHGLVIDSTISGNGGECGPGGIVMVGAQLVSSTVAGNRGGYCAEAGGVIAFDSTIIDSTISGNSVGERGFGPIGAGGILASGTTIVSSTITANVNMADTPYSAAGSAGLISDTDAPTRLSATIVAGNVGGSRPMPDLGGTNNGPANPACGVTSDGNNLIGDTTGCTFAATPSDLVGVDPLLGPLADNGGPTLTHALLAGSPAIDAFTCARRDSSPACLVTTDQRGIRRPQDGDGNHGRLYDIGSVEMARHE